MSSNNAVHKTCSACKQDLPKSLFSKRQWKNKLDSARRCTECIEGDNGKMRLLRSKKKSKKAAVNIAKKKRKKDGIRKKKKKLVQKTRLDDRGYLVTETVWDGEDENPKVHSAKRQKTAAPAPIVTPTVQPISVQNYVVEQVAKNDRKQDLEERGGPVWRSHAPIAPDQKIAIERAIEVEERAMQDAEEKEQAEEARKLNQIAEEECPVKEEVINPIGGEFKEGKPDPHKMVVTLAECLLAEKLFKTGYEAGFAADDLITSFFLLDGDDIWLPCNTYKELVGVEIHLADHILEELGNTRLSKDRALRMAKAALFGGPYLASGEAISKATVDASAGILSVIPIDTVNPHLLKFLDLRDCLRLIVTCKTFVEILNPYQYGYIYDLYIYREYELSDKDSDSEFAEDEGDNCLIPEAIREEEIGSYPPVYLPSREIENYVYWQDKFLSWKAAKSNAILQSILKNDVIGRHYGPGKEEHLRGDAYELIRQIVESLILCERYESLEHVCEAGRASVQDLEFAIQTWHRKSADILKRFPYVMKDVVPCASCKSGIGAFQCRRNADGSDSCMRLVEDADLPGSGCCKNRNEKFCADCMKMSRFCRVCHKYECQPCSEENFTEGGGWRDNYMRRMIPDEIDVRYKTCSKCKMNACFALRKHEDVPTRCYIECNKCRIVVCSNCNEHKWSYCSFCSDPDGVILEAYCHKCTKDTEGGCPTHGLWALKSAEIYGSR